MITPPRSQPPGAQRCRVLMCADVCPHLFLAYLPCRSYWGCFAVLSKFWTGRNLETGPANTTPTPVCPAGLILQQLTGTRAQPCQQRSAACSRGLSGCSQTWRGFTFLQLGERRGKNGKGCFSRMLASCLTKFEGLGSLCFSGSLLCYAHDTCELQTTVQALWGEVWYKALGTRGQAGRASLEHNSPAK